jgi:phage terminase large subunit GpA-like protein
VSPERNDLVGWQEADTETQAKEQSCFRCPGCQRGWTEDQRKAANINSRLIHKGQELTESGEIVGSVPAGSTLGFRWSAVNNLLIKSGSYGVDEWKASRADDEDNAEKQMRQFVWCLPYVADKEDVVSLSIDTIQRRQHDLGQGVYPDGTQHITIGMDSGKYRSWYVEVAWTADGRAYVVNYGQLDVPTNQLGLESALLVTLNEFADQCSSNSRPPDAVWYDASYEPEIHYRFQRESTAEMFQPVQGYGVAQRSGTYNHPPKRTSQHIWLGEQMMCVRDMVRNIKRVDLNADYWKEQAHKSLVGPVDRKGSATLFQAPGVEHLMFARHMMAEKKQQEFIPEKGLVTKWLKIKKDNHYFDCLAYALAAGSRFGYSTVATEAKQQVSSVRFSDLARNKGI